MYDKKIIMKNAWKLFKSEKNKTLNRSFGECLHRAWNHEKKRVLLIKQAVANNNFEMLKVIDGARIYIDRRYDPKTGFNGWALSNQTYPARDKIKAMGFQFDRTEREWRTDDINVAVMFYVA